MQLMRCIEKELPIDYYAGTYDGLVDYVGIYQGGVSYDPENYFVIVRHDISGYYCTNNLWTEYFNDDLVLNQNINNSNYTSERRYEIINDSTMEIYYHIKYKGSVVENTYEGFIYKQWEYQFYATR